MSTNRITRLIASWRLALWLVLLAVAAGCDRTDVRVYRAPKDSPVPSVGHGSQRAAGPEIPRIRWKLPTGWEERTAEGIRVARCTIPAKDGPDTDVSVIPMPGLSAGQRDIVNLWRQQVKLDPLSEEAIAQAVQKVVMDSSQADLFEMVSGEPLIEEKFKARILVAMLKREDAMWFFKMTGTDEEVLKHKPAFLELLRTVEFEGAPSGGTATTGAPTLAAGESSSRPVWVVPSGWQEVPPTQMVVAKFVATAGPGKAEISVSSFPGDTGGLLANVNRWRGQVGLGALGPEGLDREVTPLDGAESKAMLVDVTGERAGQNIRLVGAIVPRAGNTWFYKLVGDAMVVDREKAAFVGFVKSVRYP